MASIRNVSVSANDPRDVYEMRIIFACSTRMALGQVGGDRSSRTKKLAYQAILLRSGHLFTQAIGLCGQVHALLPDDQVTMGFDPAHKLTL